MNYANLLTMVLDGTDEQRQIALNMVYSEDEWAIGSLIDLFYAGVNEATGLLIIHVVRDIGGFEASDFLGSLSMLSQPYASWRFAAQSFENCSDLK